MEEQWVEDDTRADSTDGVHKSYCGGDEKQASRALGCALVVSQSEVIPDFLLVCELANLLVSCKQGHQEGEDYKRGKEGPVEYGTLGDADDGAGVA